MFASNAKALVVVLTLALLTFYVCKPIALHFMQAETFARRRNVWVALTVGGFLLPTFWMWMLCATPILIWAANRDASPLGLFCMLMFVLPEVSYFVPAPFVNQLLPMTPIRLLVICIVSVAVLRIWGQRARSALRWSDWLLAAFLVLQIVLLAPYETTTTTMRRSVLLVLDSFAIFYAFARLWPTAHLRDAIASFWLALVVMAAAGIFESLWGWLLYIGIGQTWGDPNVFAYIARAGSLRAQVAGGHSINFGYQMAVGLGLYLFLRTIAKPPAMRDVAIIGVMSAAILVSYSRGAWLTAVVAVVLFCVLRPEAMRKLPGAIAIGVVTIGAMAVSPLQDKVLSRLPFVGNVDQDTIEYRQTLSTFSWGLVKQNPWFGDPFAASKMESLRQGQGIIDIVNGYLFTALFTGYVGLALQCSVYAIALVAGMRAWRRAADRDDRTLFASLCACLGATVVYIATAGHGATALILCSLIISASAPLVFSKRGYNARPIGAPGYAR